MAVLTAEKAGFSAGECQARLSSTVSLVTSYVTASLTMLTWDLLVNLDDEISSCAQCHFLTNERSYLLVQIEYVWRWPKSWFKGVYCFIRYFPLIGETTFSSLIQWFQQYFALQAVAAAVAVISILKVYILYDRSKWLLLLLIHILVACAVVSIAGFAKYRTSYIFDGSCLTTFESDFVLIGWTLPVTFESILFIVVLVKFIQNTRSTPYLAGQPVLLVFLRDGIAAFLAIFTVTCVTVASSVAFVELSSGFFFWNMTVYSIAGSHVLLNLREIVTRTTHPSTMETFQESISMEFQVFQPGRETGTSDWTTDDEDAAFDSMEMEDRQPSDSGRALEVC
ncbi:uncharacterized protein C8Q71DRAFT_887300 [Rhodofomes roseus]|uniref:Transmembrane protein n=1 Tax=Rhodofomes roseus TaxID=34475 RepID=A0ABQ8JZX5_9APHY|nr:uncharacterized protein C8Q71DRAFT_887300 [Rhodofomes roseus]KAH9829940.1 hypothetical protein C8Q71DRAFT_887300 [Rhodofomes roseus]